MTAENLLPELATYEQLNHADRPTVLCPMQWMGDGSVAKGVLRFSPKTSPDWVLETYQSAPPYTGIYHLLTDVGSPITPTAVYFDTSNHNTQSLGLLVAEVSQADKGTPGHMTHFVVDHVVVAGVGVNKFAIRVP